MYVPKKFIPTSAKEVNTFIKENSFATLFSQYLGKPIATHTPLFFLQEDVQDYLIGHIAKANEQHHCFDGKSKLLAVFTNQHSYVSSSWYSIPQAPTWNYISVHITGTAVPMSDAEARQLLSDMVDNYEAQEEKPFKVTDMPAPQFAAMLQAIVAFKIKVENIEASFKLSQNRSAEDHKNIITQLKKRGDEFSTMIAEDMEKTGIFDKNHRH